MAIHIVSLVVIGGLILIGSVCLWALWRLDVTAAAEVEGDGRESNLLNPL